MSEVRETSAQQPETPRLIKETSLYPGRPSDFYLELLGLKKADLEGNTVLNIGAGGSDLKSDLEKDGVEVAVIDIDRGYGTKIPKSTTKERRLVGGDVARLPLKTASVDYVLALYLGFLETELHPSVLREMIRVAKRKVVVYPWEGKFQDMQEYINAHGLSDSVTIDKPKPGIQRILAANLRHQKGLKSKLARGTKNVWYLYNILVDRLLKSKRVTIDIENLRRHEDSDELVKGFLNAASQTQGKIK